MRFGPRFMTIALGVVTAPLLVLGISACGGDVGGTATTVVPIAPTDFATIPPVITTAPVSNTTLPPGSVGVEQSYVVELGDSPIKLATMYGISVEELLMYNGWVSVTQFPYPGQTLRIPANATQPVDNGTSQTPATGNTSAPTGPVGPGCGTRPAGTYEIQSGDSMWAITKKFCITEAQLRAANEWATGPVTFLIGDKINIPAANG
ncbi:MAG: LysM peptidoglycan-binding domain-containing protein [Actinobacteria bacterium]|nr:LysM peptidoglycan-binding domain-containing protein [Actinomycetota bacterium]